MLRAALFRSDHVDLSLQFDATFGYEKSVSNLSWSYASFRYASFLSAVRAKVVQGRNGGRRDGDGRADAAVDAARNDERGRTTEPAIRSILAQHWTFCQAGRGAEFDQKGRVDLLNRVMLLPALSRAAHHTKG